MANLFGRTVIKTDVEEITSQNVLDVLDEAEKVFENNLSDMNTLWDYYCGKQEIQNRTKTIRDDIMNIITENRAKEIVDFKVGYLCQGPIVYVSRNGEDASVSLLNDYMVAENKASKDKTLFTYQAIFGTAYKFALPDTEYVAITGDETFQSDEAPFEMFTVEPRKGYVIYSSGIGEKPMAGVYRVVDSEDKVHQTVYTETEWFKVYDGEITERGTNGIGRIPLVEYPANEARLGAFEPVMSLLDAINTLDSNRMDGIEQFIQSLIVLTNCELPEGYTAKSMLESGLVQLRSSGDMQSDIKILAEQLDQSQTQTLKDDLYQSVLTICAMPNRNGGSSTSDTGIAVVYRDGWSSAETSAQGTELMFRQGEMEFLKVVLAICGNLSSLELTPSKLEVKFSRRNYEHIESKSNVLISMLNNEKIDPKLAFIYSNMFADPEEAYKTSMAWYESNKVAEPSEVTESEPVRED